jgi:hypothetical protein
VVSASFPDAALGAGSRIGRYFGIVSVIPSALFVLFLYALVSSGAWDGKPDSGASADALRSISLGEASALLVVTLAFALVLHPLQFALTQAMGGDVRAPHAAHLKRPSASRQPPPWPQAGQTKPFGQRSHSR